MKEVKATTHLTFFSSCGTKMTVRQRGCSLIHCLYYFCFCLESHIRLSCARLMLPGSSHSSLKGTGGSDDAKHSFTSPITLYDLTSQVVNNTFLVCSP